MNLKTVLISLFCFLTALNSAADTDNIPLQVWVNEAIVATYTFNYKTYTQDQQKIARYFTTEGWIAYTRALNASKLLKSVQKNSYNVTAVATQPPQISTVDANHWQASMPLLVHYENPQYQQQQNLNIVLGITQASPGQGVRGFAITSLQATTTSPPCVCTSPQSS